MRWGAFLLLLPGCCLVGISSQAFAEDRLAIGQTERGVPVHTAILTRRYGAVVPENEIAGEELEAGLGATNIFKAVHWRRWNRPSVWGGWGWNGGWGGGWYGGWGWRGAAGPWYGVGFGPRYYGYYPWGGWRTGWGYAGFGYSGWGYPGWQSTYWRGPMWGGAWGGYPQTTVYWSQPAFRARYGGCYYW